MKTLNNYIPMGLVGDGLFSRMFDAVWYTDIDGVMLDIEFFSKYGTKYAGALISQLATNNNVETLTSEQLELIATYLYNKHKAQWEHKYKITKLEYNPIENFKTTTHEEEIRDIDETREDAREIESSSDSNSKIYGFDSNVATDDATGNSTSSGSDEFSRTDTRDEQNTRDKTVTGNIGVKPLQDMLRLDVEFWMWNFFEDIMNDISKDLTLKIY